jgi:hypothetical protein
MWCAKDAFIYKYTVTVNLQNPKSTFDNQVPVHNTVSFKTSSGLKQCSPFLSSQSLVVLVFLKEFLALKAVSILRNDSSCFKCPR